ncbi:MAG: Endoglucanase precursor, partial [Labilithrix sp.]|nr:Endoglucanase precursor [Labilithrix sp.]
LAAAAILLQAGCGTSTDASAPVAPVPPVAPDGGAAPSAPEACATSAGRDASSCNREPSLPLPSGAADVEVRIHADVAPHAATKSVVVDRRLYGMSIADWQSGDYVPTPRPAFLTYLSALEPGVLRWPAGHRSQEYVWQRGGAGQTGSWVLTPAHVDAFVALAHAVHAEPLVAINVKRSTAAAAADLVRYLVVDHSYGVRWFQIGNEPDLTDGIYTNRPEAFADALVAFADAMRAVDPNIRFVGPELLTGANATGIHGRRDWMTPIVSRAAGRLSGLSWHYYPLDSAQQSTSSSALFTLGHLFQEYGPDWRPSGMSYVDEIMPALARVRDQYAPEASVWVSELAVDPGPAAGAGISDTIAGGLWVADVLGRYAEYGPGAVIAWIFKGNPEQAYGLLGPGDQPRATYGVYWLYARHFGDHLVESSSTALTEVNAHAALRSDGALTLVLVNKTSTARHVHVALRGACASHADALTLEGEGLSSKDFHINDVALTTANVAGGIAPIPLDPGKMFEIDVPPTSVRLIAYRHGG